jgi:hypothetical protein
MRITSLQLETIQELLLSPRYLETDRAKFYVHQEQPYVFSLPKPPLGMSVEEILCVKHGTNGDWVMHINKPFESDPSKP